MSDQLKQRNASVDYLRFIGALGIIQFHMALPGAWIGLSALPMFVTLIVLYGTDRPLIAHARRLLIPWVVWSVIYGVGKLVQAKLLDQPFVSEFAPWMVLTGLSLHLWFLPFAFLFLALAGPLLRILAPTVQLVVALAASLLALWAINTMVLPLPLPQWCATLPAAFAGLVIARRAGFIPVLTLLGGGAAVLIGLGWEQATWQLLLASLVLGAVLALPLQPTRLSGWAAEVSFGMYLIHPLVYSLALYVLPPQSLEIYGLVVAGSILGTMMVQRLMPRAV